MRFSYPHGTTKKLARERIERAIPELRSRTGGRAEDISYHWEADTLRYALRGRGLSISGTLAVTDTTLEIDLSLPLALRPFEGEARRRITGGLDELFARGKADA
jgi:hypothetical protein